MAGATSYSFSQRKVIPSTVSYALRPNSEQIWPVAKGPRTGFHETFSDVRNGVAHSLPQHIAGLQRGGHPHQVPSTVQDLSALGPCKLCTGSEEEGCMHVMAYSLTTPSSQWLFGKQQIVPKPAPCWYRIQEVSAEKRLQHKAGFPSLGFSPKHRYSCLVTEDAHATARSLCAGTRSMKQHYRTTGPSLLALRALSLSRIICST